MTLLPFVETRDMAWEYLPRMNRSMLRFYQLLLLLAGCGLVALFQFRVPVSVPAAGIIRPALERTEIHSGSGGIIEKIFVKEGDTVRQHSLLFLMHDVAGPAEALANETEIVRQQDLIQDLQRLTFSDSISHQLLLQLKTPLYRAAASSYLARAEGETLNWTGARHETDLGRLLVKDKVISPKEFYDQQLREDKMRMAFTALRRSQWTSWQSELAEHKRALADCVNRQTEFRSRAEQREVRAPVPGVVQGLRSWYCGSAVRPEQALCSVSPEGDLIGECYVPSRDAGLLRPGQALRIRVDAFNANYFGVLYGRISSISNDIAIVDNKPVFFVRCVFDQPQKGTVKSYRGLLKKGLGFQARCIVAERTLFQLLYDSMEDWFSPFAPAANSA